jgi:hypothetical protein
MTTWAEILKQAVPYLSLSSLFVVVKSIVSPKTRSGKSLAISVLGGVPLSALIGLTVFEYHGSLFLSLLVTAMSALIAEHLIIYIVNNAPIIIKEGIEKWIKSRK